MLQFLISSNIKDTNTLFFYYKCKEQFNAYGVDNMYGAFSCMECTFTLDFARMTLLQAIQHKCDNHLLKLIMTKMMIQNSITVIFVKEKETQTIGIIIVQFAIILFIPNVFLEDILFSKMEALGGILRNSVLSRRLMGTMTALSVSFATLKRSSVLHATLLSTANVGKVSSG